MLHAAKCDWQVFAVGHDARYCHKMASLSNNWQRELFENAGDFAGLSRCATIMKTSDEEQ
jgi:hypothetical protein